MVANETGNLKFIYFTMGQATKFWSIREGSMKFGPRDIVFRAEGDGDKNAGRERM